MKGWLGKLGGPLRLPSTRRPTVAQLVFVLLSLGLVWRTLRYGLGFPIWGDEAFVAVNFVVRDFRGMLAPLVYGQIVPLGFMWAELGASRVLGLSEWALRLLPYLAGVAALLLFWRFAGAVLPRRAALLAIGILAVARYPIRHAAEVKPYATDLLVALLLTMLAWRVYEEPRCALRWAALILLAALAPWCSYPAVFNGGGAGLLLTWRLLRTRGQRPILAGWLLYGVVLCGSFGLMYWSYGRPHAEHAARLVEIDMWKATFPPLAEPWKLPVWFFLIHAGNMLAYPLGGKAPGSVVTLVLVVVGAVQLWRRQPQLTLLLLAPLALTFVAAGLRAYPYGGSARVSLHMAPAFCLLAGLGLFCLLRHFLRRQRFVIGLRVAVLVLGLIGVGGLVADLLQPFKSVPVYRSHAAVREVGARTAPGDRWVVFNADRPVPYAPYLGAWRGVGGQFVFDVLRFAPGPVEFAPRADQLALPARGRLWLFVYRAESRKKDVVFPQDLLEQYLDAAGARLGPAQHESFLVKQEPEQGKFESIDVYGFGR